MARIRTIKPEFWTDEKIGQLTRDVRLTFIGLISAMADDEGRCKGNPRMTRAAIYPYDETVSIAEVEAHLATLAEAQLIQRYEVNGEQYIHIRNWKQHQKIDKPTASRLPAPPSIRGGDNSPKPPRNVGEPSRPSGKERRGAETERNGEERSGMERKETAPPAARQQEKLANPPLPPGALRFIETYYGRAKATRRDDVTRQLIKTLTPDGAKRPKGKTNARAAGWEHLDHVAAGMLMLELRDHDKAILALLNELEETRMTWALERNVARDREEFGNNGHRDRGRRGKLVAAGDVLAGMDMRPPDSS